ncbi:hypothetical protein ACFFJI_09335 [Allobacillus sp. GCM10007491]|uniref:Uncharacterized protein n=2 Tax=Allobacillus TaxID=1400133 RepID=A0A941CV68_9BACI|nr:MULTISPECIES: hypothetical protein [Allobacillus]MBR7553141.1 hypothetical protein [Allobacillus saliphilus]TSJ62377.1 hypothetical protein FPQ13_10315 [Allobacillus salarius]
MCKLNLIDIDYQLNGNKITLSVEKFNSLNSCELTVTFNGLFHNTSPKWDVSKEDLDGFIDRLKIIPSKDEVLSFHPMIEPGLEVYIINDNPHYEDMLKMIFVLDSGLLGTSRATTSSGDAFCITLNSNRIEEFCRQYDENIR